MPLHEWLIFKTLELSVRMVCKQKLFKIICEIVNSFGDPYCNYLTIETPTGSEDENTRNHVKINGSGSGRKSNSCRVVSAGESDHKITCLRSSKFKITMIHQWRKFTNQQTCKGIKNVELSRRKRLGC